MKNPIRDKNISLEAVGMLYIIAIILKQNGDESMQISRRDIELSMGLKLGLDQKHDRALKSLAHAGYIRQTQVGTNIFISLL